MAEITAPQGSTQRTDEPATAVAISHRMNSSARSYGVAIPMRTTHLPARSTAATAASCAASGAI